MVSVGRMTKRELGDDPQKDTRLTLTLTAERLFALEGVSNTPLRRIIQEAGQRNESAIHYYFGSREAVVQSIMNHRTKGIDAERISLLEAERMSAGGRPLTMRAIAQILQNPLAHYLRRSRGEGYYIRFLAQLWLDRAMWRKFENQSQDVGVAACLQELRRANPHLPASVVNLRYGVALQINNFGLAAMEQNISDKGSEFDWKQGEVRLANMVDCIEAVLQAPLSPETVGALTTNAEIGG